MIIRKLTERDLPEMFRVFDSQDNLLKIKKTVHLDLHYKKIMPTYTDNNPTVAAMGVFDGDRLIAFTTYNEWKNLPYWTMGLFYIDAERVNEIHRVDVAGDLKDTLAIYAASRRIYTGFSISTISALNIRAWQQLHLKNTDCSLWEGDSLRYDITIEEIVPPFSTSKNIVFGQMIGIIEGRHTVPLVISRWTLKDRYRQHNISDRCLKRINKLSAA